MNSVFNNIWDKKVMVIENEVDLCLLMKVYLMRKNCRVFIFHTLFEALGGIGEIAPEIVYVDPDLCGNRNTTIKKILEAAPDVESIISGKYIIYSKQDY